MPALADGFSLEFGRQQVSNTFFTILADFNSAVVCIISTPPFISKSSSICTNPLQLYQENQLQLV